MVRRCSTLTESRYFKIKGQNTTVNIQTMPQLHVTKDITICEGPSTTTDVWNVYETCSFGSGTPPPPPWRRYSFQMNTQWNIKKIKQIFIAPCKIAFLWTRFRWEKITFFCTLCLLFFRRWKWQKSKTLSEWTVKEDISSCAHYRIEESVERTLLPIARFLIL